MKSDLSGTDGLDLTRSNVKSKSPVQAARRPNSKVDSPKRPFLRRFGFPFFSLRFGGSYWLIWFFWTLI